MDAHDSDNFQDHMIAYTTSILQDDIIKGKWYSRLKCDQCFLAFSEDEILENDLMSLKMKSKNLRPVSKSAFDLCKTTEKLMERYNYDHKYYKNLSSEVLKVLHLHEIFSYSDFDMHAEDDHKKLLIELIIKMYVNKRQLYISKCNTLAAHDVFLRNQLKKVVHFKGQ